MVAGWKDLYGEEVVYYLRDGRVRGALLLENLEDGAQVSQFVEWFPGVSLEQARSVLEHAAQSALAPA